MQRKLNDTQQSVDDDETSESETDDVDIDEVDPMERQRRKIQKNKDKKLKDSVAPKTGDATVFFLKQYILTAGTQENAVINILSQCLGKQYSPDHFKNSQHLNKDKIELTFLLINAYTHYAIKNANSVEKKDKYRKIRSSLFETIGVWFFRFKPSLMTSILVQLINDTSIDFEKVAVRFIEKMNANKSDFNFAWMPTLFLIPPPIFVGIGGYWIDAPKDQSVSSVMFVPFLFVVGKICAVYAS